MGAPATCAITSRELHEPARGTAPVARGWLLVEQPGPWGRDAVLASQLDAEVAHELTRRTADLDVRIQLIRRVGRPEDDDRVAFLVHAGPRRTWARRLTFTDERALLDLDPDVATQAQPPPVGESHDDPLYLVCTHAKRDACCAMFGRPVASALAGAYGDAVWETSHLGGHRFAANLVMLPTGHVYGRVDGSDALRLVETARRGLVDLDLLRGRSSLDRWAQAADWYLRERTHLLGVEDVAVERVDSDDDEADVTATADGRRWLVRLRRTPTGRERLTGCDKTEPVDPYTTTLVAIEPRPDPTH